MSRRAPSLAALLAALLVCWCCLAPPAGWAQAITGDDLAAVMLGDGDLAGFRLAADGSPALVTGATREQRTRLLIPLSGIARLISLVVSAPTDDTPCLAYLPDAVRSGDVLATHNDDRGSFQPIGPLGVGDVDTAGTWEDVDAGSNATYHVFAEVFLRGRLSVYLTVIDYGDGVDAETVLGWARLQDAKLLAAGADPASPAGALAVTPMPPRPAQVPDACG